MSAVLLLATAHCLSAAEPAEANASSPIPFLRLRDTTLGYHGADADLTNLSEIRIGWFGPTNLSDPLTGKLWWAANQAIRDTSEHHTPPIDSSFVIRHSSFNELPIRLVSRWSVDPWGTGVAQLTRMVYDEQPLALLGSVDSASTHLAEQIAAKANLPLVSPIATDKSITLAGVSWMFSCAPSDAAIARVLVDAMLAEASDSPEKSVLLVTTDHESRMTLREVLKELSRRGRAPGFRFDVTPGAADITRQLQAAVEAKPAVVLIVAGTEDAARLVGAVRSRLGGIPILGSHSMGRTRFRELAGTAAEGVRFPLLFFPDPADTCTARFMECFAAEYHHPPDYTAALTYDATRLLIEAIHRAGPNRARIREALAGLSPWPGIAGPIHFDGTGQNTQTNLRMGTIRNGTSVPLPALTEHTQTASSAPLR